MATCVTCGSNLQITNISFRFHVVCCICSEAVTHNQVLWLEALSRDLSSSESSHIVQGKNILVKVNVTRIS